MLGIESIHISSFKKRRYGVRASTIHPTTRRLPSVEKIEKCLEFATQDSGERNGALVTDTIGPIRTRGTSEHPLENWRFADEEVSVNFEKLVFYLQIKRKKSC